MLPAWISWTILAIVVAAIALGAVLLVSRRARAAEPASDRRAARFAVAAAIESLGEITDPRSAVIAAYAAMERTLASHGVRRAPAEAPQEYLRRLLSATTGTEREVRTLTALFEEARFSTHPIPERARELALSVLSSLRSRLHAQEAP